MRKKNIFRYIPAAMAVILPFVVGKRHYRNRFRGFVWSSDAYWMTDDFLIYKGIVLMIFVLLLITACLAYLKRDKGCGTGRKIYWEWVLYLGLVFASAAKSRYPLLSFLGANDQFEPVWIQAAYIGCAFFTAF